MRSLGYVIDLGKAGGISFYFVSDLGKAGHLLIYAMIRVRGLTRTSFFKWLHSPGLSGLIYWYLRHTM